MSLELCESHFDRVEVGTVRGQVEQPRAFGLDGIFGGLALVGWKIVEDDDIAFGQGWGELPLMMNGWLERTGCGIDGTHQVDRKECRELCRAHPAE